MIRKLRKTDLDEVAYIWLHTNKKAHDFIAETYWDEHFEMVEGMLGDAEIYVFEEQGQIKGFVGLDGEYIAGIFVREKEQSLGIGKQLLDFVKSLKGQLKLNVYQKNERAIKFYTREQFEIQDEQTDEATGEAEYQMLWKRQAGGMLDAGTRTIEFIDSSGTTKRYNEALLHVKRKTGKCCGTQLDDDIDGVFYEG